MTEPTIDIVIASRVGEDSDMIGGSTTTFCKWCRAEVWLAPATSDLRPLRILCLPCAIRRIGEMRLQGEVVHVSMTARGEELVRRYLAKCLVN